MENELRYDTQKDDVVLIFLPLISIFRWAETGACINGFKYSIYKYIVL